MKTIKNAGAKAVHEWVEAGEAVIIDIRESIEHATRRIPGAIHNPMSAFNPDLLPDDGKKMIFMCSKGIRSVTVGQYLLDHDLLDEAYNLVGGMIAWTNAGLPLETEPVEA